MTIYLLISVIIFNIVLSNMNIDNNYLILFRLLSVGSLITCINSYLILINQATARFKIYAIANILPKTFISISTILLLIVKNKSFVIIILGNILGLFITSHLLKWFKKGILFRILSYVVIALIVSSVMTILNAIVITPSYLTVFGPEPHFSTCFEEGVIQNTAAYLTGNKDTTYNAWSYIGIIAGIHGPFNLLKAAACCLLYEVLFNRLIFIFMRRSPFFQKWFIGDIVVKKVEDTPEVDEVIE